MAHVSVTQHHHKPGNEVRAIVEEVTDHLKQRHGIRHEWQNDRQLTFRGRGITGTLTIDDEAVHIELELGMLLRPLRSRIEAELRQEMAERLSTS